MLMLQDLRDPAKVRSWLREPDHLSLILRPTRLPFSQAQLSTVGLLMAGGGGDGDACSFGVLADCLVKTLNVTDIGLGPPSWPQERLCRATEEACSRLSSTGDFLVDASNKSIRFKEYEHK